MTFEKFVVTAPMGVTLPAGTVMRDLTEDQIRRRRDIIKSVAGSQFRALRPVNFKRGETITIVATNDVNRAALHALSGAESDEGKAAADALARRRASSAKLSPAAAKLAAENDLDPERIAASGKGGKITVADVKAAIANGGGAPTGDPNQAPAA